MSRVVRRWLRGRGYDPSGGAGDRSPEHIRVDAGELAGLGEPLEVPIADQFRTVLAFTTWERNL